MVTKTSKIASHPEAMSRGTVLVTGGAKRIGRAISIKLASKGYSIAVHYHQSSKEASELVDMIRSKGEKASTFQANLSDSSSVSNLISQVTSSLGPMVGLVNNASVFIHDDISTINDRTWDSHMNVNAKAPALLIKELNKVTNENMRASVVNILDQKISNPNPDYLSYTASRYALLGLTETLARGLAPRIRVNAVAPGHTLVSDHQSHSGFIKAQSESPLGSGPTPEDIANTVSFLMDAQAITGQVIFVDAGERFLSRNRDVLFETED
jgi:NAD(P)-dependent dehydrogenase (short-subunit alcohol dehydrogenase family)